MNRNLTYRDIENMSPEELEELKRQASIAIVKRLVAIFLFKLAVGFLLRRWARKLEES